MFPKASSATLVATDICSCAFRDIWRKKLPRKDPTRIIPGKIKTINDVNLGDKVYNVKPHPIICVVLRRPCDITCLNELLKSWISLVSLLKKYKTEKLYTRYQHIWWKYPFMYLFAKQPINCMGKPYLHWKKDTKI